MLLFPIGLCGTRWATEALEEGSRVAAQAHSRQPVPTPAQHTDLGGTNGVRPLPSWVYVGSSSLVSISSAPLPSLPHTGSRCFCPDISAIGPPCWKLATSSWTNHREPVPACPSAAQRLGQDRAGSCRVLQPIEAELGSPPAMLGSPSQGVGCIPHTGSRPTLCPGTSGNSAGQGA